MRLHLIKRKSDKTFFVRIDAYCMLRNSGVDVEYWSEKPQTFLKTPDGVAGNLRKLCSEPYWDTTRPDGLSPRITNYREIGWRNFDASKLAQFEVVVMDVDVISMRATPATDFVQIDAIENHPLNRGERRA